MIVFIVEHTREDDDSSDTKFCGVFSTLENAESAVARLLECPGFRDYREGFEIHKLVVDQVHWQEGFVSAIWHVVANA